MLGRSWAKVDRLHDRSCRSQSGRQVGAGVHQLESERKLRDAYQIALLLASVDDDETARAWFCGMNPALDHRAPAWVIANFPDGGDRAMAAALAFVSYG